MKLIRPTTITDAMLTSDVPEGAGTAYNSGTTYALNARVDVTTGSVLDIYEGIRDGNRLLYSQQVDNAAWSKARASVTANATAAPDSAMTADKLVEDSTATNSHAAGQGVACTTGQVYTFSFYAKAAERHLLTLQFLGATAVAQACFDLTTGSVISTAGTAHIESVGSGWYRCSVSGLADQAAMTCYSFLQAASGSLTYTGDGSSGLYLWQGQLEVGTSAGPSIVTTSAAILNLNNAPASSPNWWRKVATTYAAYSSGTTYAQDVIVISTTTHRRYKSVSSGNVGHDPTLPTSSAFWTDIGPTNRWAMFDEGVGSRTTETGVINVTLAPGSVDSLAVLDTDAELVQVTMTVSGSPVYDTTKTTNVGGNAITDWFLYFFEPIGKKDVLTFLDLPVYPSASIAVKLTGADPAGAVSVGTLIVGRQLLIGSTEVGVTSGIVSYSKINIDDFGVRTVAPRAWAKKMECRCILDIANVDSIYAELAKVRDEACLYIGEDGFDHLSVYGFFNDFSFDLAFANLAYCSMTVQGLT